MTQHIRKGMGVDSPYGPHLWLDIRHLGAKHINTNLREIANICKNFTGVDPVNSLIPVRPTQHYSMGGIRTNIDGAAYGLKSLFAVGEAACWDLHGFNRLGGNSLAETIVSGWVVGKKVAEYTMGTELKFSYSLIQDFAKQQQERIENLISKRHGSENVYQIRSEMEQTLTNNVGIFRNEQDLKNAVEKLKELLQRAGKIGLRSDVKSANPELGSALRLPSMLRLALCISYGALQRTESRGSHAREDYPKRDDVNWLKRTLAHWKEGSELPELSYEPVKITESPPGDRGYGESSATPAEGNKKN